MKVCLSDNMQSKDSLACLSLYIFKYAHVQIGSKNVTHCLSRIHAEYDNISDAFYELFIVVDMSLLC